MLYAWQADYDLNTEIMPLIWTTYYVPCNVHWHGGRRVLISASGPACHPASSSGCWNDADYACTIPSWPMHIMKGCMIMMYML